MNVPLIPVTTVAHVLTLSMVTDVSVLMDIMMHSANLISMNAKTILVKMVALVLMVLIGRYTFLEDFSLLSLCETHFD